MYGATPWEMFRFQQGTTRLGLAGVLSWSVGHLSGLSTRAESFVMAGVSGLSCIIFWGVVFFSKEIEDKKKFFLLFLAPFLFFTLSSFETYLGAPNPAHAVIPVFLILCLMASFFFKGWIAVGLKIGFCFLLFNSGYGHIPAYAFLILSSVRLFHYFRALFTTKKFNNEIFQQFLGFLGCLFAIYFYFPDLQNGTTAEEKEGLFNFSNLLKLPLFAAGEISRSLGASRVNFVIVLGACIFLYWIFEIFRQGKKVLKGPIKAEREAWIFLSLASLIFILASSFGRLANGLGSSITSRYVLYVNLGLLSLIYFVPLFKNKNVTRAILGILGFFLIQEFRPRGRDQRMMESYKAVKLEFQNCYLEKKNFEICWTLNSGDKIYPSYLPSLQARMDILEKNNWSLFKDKNTLPNDLRQK